MIDTKINIIEQRILTLNLLIKELSNLIESNPEGDHPEKKSRSQILLEYENRKTALESYLEALTNSN